MQMSTIHGNTLMGTEKKNRGIESTAKSMKGRGKKEIGADAGIGKEMM